MLRPFVNKALLVPVGESPSFSERPSTVVCGGGRRGQNRARTREVRTGLRDSQQGYMKEGGDSWKASGFPKHVPSRMLNKLSREKGQTAIAR